MQLRTGEDYPQLDDVVGVKGARPMTVVEAVIRIARIAVAAGLEDGVFGGHAGVARPQMSRL